MEGQVLLFAVSVSIPHAKPAYTASHIQINISLLPRKCVYTQTLPLNDSIRGEGGVNFHAPL
ncbi:MAG: hypothetical protein A3G39_05370 [Deltaproteobacteria bacterium RIFCSPLOWO2_12_FULL_43_16]|nr:MAG: hypothetical protein A2Z89_02080 [Deltaproteobacteria bacterium GWA2_43_19]OGQ11533.1 MAG: hypothetical protein A3D30_07280 [Deltaproteobacteria bacterium RIFCSPHIGHO2_02_FULL_43_33]OGQ37407.1 MAG: hypothetical protein A3A85_06115 [Deltaproteobacteria bacterium RIFCSPLOWO2_01_FULL_42_9]OGQ60847.1 MAG: hypothetical protein A3G39_05370 [Deltaproteobacteria bacterium RIFCSPLOWO2_12_FULL_43_16]HBR16899.1 hypothetical protein [Deltaproteobacteria bacterium]